MISLTRLSGTVFALNSDLVERIDSTPDTVITLVDGKKYVVAETMSEVISTICRYRAEIIALSSHLQAGDLVAVGQGNQGTSQLATVVEHRRPSLSVVDTDAPTDPEGGLR
ncbi:flagellar FlbD family protein [Nocardioides sp. GY 10127]|uniref:flagellar FlbD family protein n=1 Tax=Nocardioides sp. GY 10127 TaxID=2569762 RepID=UPI0010A7F671|nr:flagellar FlbD family protein [Nocardioides sp. GY 10127]TIC78635.1 flagellar protein FlbD [Nocardioides sp. GY 10127]